MTLKQYQAALDKAYEISNSLAEKTQLPYRSVEHVQLWHDGDFTVAVVNGQYMGCTKRNRKTDKYNRVTGDYTALTRALKVMYQIRD